MSFFLVFDLLFLLSVCLALLGDFGVTLVVVFPISDIMLGKQVSQTLTFFKMSYFTKGTAPDEHFAQYIPPQFLQSVISQKHSLLFLPTMMLSSYKIKRLLTCSTLVTLIIRSPARRFRWICLFRTSHIIHIIECLQN